MFDRLMRLVGWRTFSGKWDHIEMWFDILVFVMLGIGVSVGLWLQSIGG